MRALRQKIAGQLIQQDKKTGILLRQERPDPTADDLLYLRFAFVIRGPGDHIFPAFILDDWGRETRSLKLYRWVRENGERFPRGEIFGYEQDGRETQCFIRELELYARYPCYVYQDEAQPIPEGILLNAVFMVDERSASPQRLKRPVDIKGPLYSSFVTWWKVPPNFDNFEMLLLSAHADPGF